ncbi:MAG: pyruvate dehydrogenase complex dihydrolipoamide acetyltransferase [Verrucomicrobiota bacterium]
MATFIEMPKLSDTMTEGTLLAWQVEEGDKVEIGDIIAEVETDKATMEMEAFDEGILGKIYVQGGEKAPVGAALAVLVEEGEEAPASPGAATAAPPQAEEKKEESSAASAPETEAPKPASSSGEKIKSSPLARKIAAEKGIDLTQVSGTGPGGRIVKKDVENFKPAPAARAGSAPSGGVSVQPGVLPVVKEGDVVEPNSSLREIIARNLVGSKQQVPHFYLRLQVDAAPLLKIRKEINASQEGKESPNKYTVNDFILMAVISALKAVPAVNASWNGDSIVKFAQIGVSVAISVPDGLVTPVIKDAGSQSLLGISQAVKDFAVRAKEGKLKPNEYDGGTITVSNLGAWGIDHFDAIINPPQACIVSVGAAKQEPVVENGELQIGTRMWLGLSVDHRVVDGALAATFMAELKKRIEKPALMLV